MYIRQTPRRKSFPRCTISLIASSCHALDVRRTRNEAVSGVIRAIMMPVDEPRDSRLYQLRYRRRLGLKRWLPVRFWFGVFRNFALHIFFIYNLSCFGNFYDAQLYDFKLEDYRWWFLVSFLILFTGPDKNYIRNVTINVKPSLYRVIS